MMRRESERKWIAVELARQLYLPEEMCNNMLQELERRRFVIRDPDDGAFRYACLDAKVDDLLGRLAILYAERRVAVISEIYSNPVSKVQTFADAFRLRKEDPQ